MVPRHRKRPLTRKMINSFSSLPSPWAVFFSPFNSRNRVFLGSLFSLGNLHFLWQRAFIERPLSLALSSCIVITCRVAILLFVVVLRFVL